MNTYDSKNKDITIPFLKWVGGKRWLVANYPDLIPKKFNKYIEPFLGSAAVYFYLKPKEAILSDLNLELISTYRAIKNNWSAVEKKLFSHKQKHCSEYYYKIRGKKYFHDTTKAARIIYLNRTCWNGLYRVNRKGDFNVPVGSRTSITYDTDDFKKTSELLSGAILESKDFEKVILKADKGDLVFVDPPYTVKHNNNNFVKYNECIFSWDDQLRLQNSLFSARDRGAKIVLCNADHSLIRDLYKNFGVIQQVSRFSSLAANSSKRQKTTELVICSH